jgi:hypothetical protein
MFSLARRFSLSYLIHQLHSIPLLVSQPILDKHRDSLTTITTYLALKEILTLILQQDGLPTSYNKRLDMELWPRAMAMLLLRLVQYLVVEINV